MNCRDVANEDAAAYNEFVMDASKHATLKKWGLIAAELLLVAIIIGLIVAIWLPALVGAREGVR